MRRGIEGQREIPGSAKTSLGKLVFTGSECAHTIAVQII